MKPPLPSWLYVLCIITWIALEYKAAMSPYAPILIKIGMATCGMLLGGLVIAQTLVYITVVWKSLAPLMPPSPVSPPPSAPLHNYAPLQLPSSAQSAPSGIMFRGGVLATGIIYQQKTYADGRVVAISIEADVDTHLSMVTYELTVDITPNLAPYCRVSASTQLDVKTLQQYVQSEFRRKLANSMSNPSLQALTLAATRKAIVHAISML